MKTMEAETSKLSKTLPDGLKEIADSGVRTHDRNFSRPRSPGIKSPVTRR